jgi:hypothetical protein
VRELLCYHNITLNEANGRFLLCRLHDTGWQKMGWPCLKVGMNSGNTWDKWTTGLLFVLSQKKVNPAVNLFKIRLNHVSTMYQTGVFHWRAHVFGTWLVQ